MSAPAQRIAVMGSGSWGTTFASLLAEAGHEVTIWGRNAEVLADITSHHLNSRYLPGITLHDTLRASPDAARALDGTHLVVLAVPSQTLRANLSAWGHLMPAEALVVSLLKGVELGTGLRMSQVVVEAAGVDQERVVVVSGPNLAKEIARHQPTATVVAGYGLSSAEQVALACSTRYFRPYTQGDVVGVEIGGAVKNVIALAVGIAEGLGFGDNAKASIITRGLAETARLAVALGGEPATLAGLAGLGDLVATCASPLSRNRTFGVALGRGLSQAEAVIETQQTAEGVASCRPILALAREQGVDMPITEQIVATVHEGLGVHELAGRLLGRPRKAEHA